ncbi:MAG: hypothetical protein L6263_00040, partial [Desulfobacteraceae bacterium]|nr:hypothetical protein [Desulfobacteraceae bacterium]
REEEKWGKEKEQEESKNNLSHIPTLESVFPAGDTFRVKKCRWKEIGCSERVRGGEAGQGHLQGRAGIS